MLRQTYESVEDFSREIKLAKVQKVFFQVGVSQQEIRLDGQLPDGTIEKGSIPGLRMTAQIVLTAITPQTIDDKQTQLERQLILAGNPIQFVFSAPLAVKDCGDEKDFNDFNEQTKQARDNVLSEVQKIANVLLFSGAVGPVAETG